MNGIHLTIYINRKHRPTIKKKEGGGGGEALLALIECTAFVKKKKPTQTVLGFSVTECSS